MIRNSLLILLTAALLAPSVARAQDAKPFLGERVLTIEHYGEGIRSDAEIQPARSTTRNSGGHDVDDERRRADR
jgi:hypothetical protein